MSYLKIKKTNLKKEKILRISRTKRLVSTARKDASVQQYKTLRPKRRVSTKESAQHEKTLQYSSSIKRRVSTARTDVQYEKNSTVVSKDASHEKSLRLKCKDHMHPVKAPRPK